MLKSSLVAFAVLIMFPTPPAPIVD